MLQTAYLIDQIIIKPVQAGQPPGGRGFFVAAVLVQKVEVFVDILPGYTAPKGGVQALGINFRKRLILWYKAPAPLHKPAEISQVAVIIKGGVGALASDDLKIAHILHYIGRGIQKGFVFGRVLFVQIN